MKTTKKVLIALLAVVVLIPLVILPAAAAPANLTQNEALNPRVIAPNSFGLNPTGNRLINGNLDINANAERWTVAAGNPPELAAFEAAYAAANPGAEWTTHRNIWFGVEFGAPVNINRVVFFETNPLGEGQTGGPENRRFVHTYVVEVATRASLAASGAYNGVNPLAQREVDPNSYSTTGWTVVGGTRTANASAENFTGGPITAEFSTPQTAEFVRVRTITTHGLGQGTVTPNFTQIQVFGTPAGGGSPQTGETAAIVVGMSVAALAVTGLVIVTRKKREIVA